MSKSIDKKVNVKIEESKINRDILKTKEEQLKELNIDNQNQSQKTRQLLGFFGAVSAIIFSQNGLEKIPGPFLGIIFSIILSFLIVCIISFQGRKVSSMININIRDNKNENEYLTKKISGIEQAKSSLTSLIIKRNSLNNLASILFAVLIFIYSFIFLIYNPMTKEEKIIFKGSDIQMHQDVEIKPNSDLGTDKNPSSQLSSGGNQVTVDEVVKASDPFKKEKNK